MRDKSPGDLDLEMSDEIAYRIDHIAIGAADISACPAHAQYSGQQICPPGYDLIAEVCIGKTTGDVVLPRDKK